MRTIRYKKQISVVNDNGSEVTLPEKTTSHAFSKGELEAAILIDNVVADTMVTPITVSLAPYPDTTSFDIYAEYVDNDLANGIESGDRAKFQIRFDSGNWLELYSLTLEGYKPTNPNFDLRASGTKKILIKRSISAT